MQADNICHDSQDKFFLGGGSGAMPPTEIGIAPPTPAGIGIVRTHDFNTRQNNVE